VTLNNSNPFAVRGKIVIRSRNRIGGRAVVFASTAFTLAPLARGVHTLTISSKERSLLKRLGRVSVNVQLPARGPAGGSVTVSKRMQLISP
jgi:hypothetical protein